ncbi:GH32 C-terminal domain-containing protein [Paenarthrobacter ureafaciens]|uniref:GH32 C-terminal domain-containing protein n=1 Tax=Paenarthrobacter ureafaciens TaxID=37931 RepID=UPI001C2CC22A|nr:GH32 C-terminal domain-containing protein [Paenarthrobacter ureafaciens]UOD81833.1 GH32 C-terminal domain-containing protein [Paenarthrobacter ureafaciens]WNZ05324.1 GH32 C-terminal domain-containing protein [Paenarthrobacter ureafaciens]
MKRSVFFQPEGAWVGDLIPFEKDGEFWLFYLHEERVTPKPGTSWHLVTTKDLTQFEYHGAALQHGSTQEPDFNAYTGSVVVDDDGTHHLFYTGQNPHRLGPNGLPLQLVMRATSSDGMRTWTKHPEDTFGAPEGYESGDWRDPFVFRDESDPAQPVWRMLIAARHATGPDRRRGVIAQCVSTDLVTWEYTDPFWDPRRYITHECPDVFQWGDWWYLVYSEFSESFTTRYRMAKSPDGPWEVPALDSIDGRAFYASKSACRDGRRFFFGWIASKEGNRDDGPWQWAGTMSVLEARQNPDGTLGFGFADELVDSFWEEVPVSLAEALPTELSAPDSYSAIISTADLPSRFYAKAVLDIAPDTTECGLLLRSSNDGDESYVLRLEPRRGRLVFDRWPREVTGDAQWHVSGDVPYDVELERPCHLAPGEHTLEVIVDGDLCVAVVDRQVALSARIYDRPSGRIGIFAGEGSATVVEFDVRQRTDN